MSSRVNLTTAKTHLSKLVARVESGEQVIITRNGEAVARLVPFTSEESVRSAKRPLGVLADRGWIADDFSEPWPVTHATGGRSLGRDRGSFAVPEDFSQPSLEIEREFYGLAGPDED
jgi:prevent-host-death family protein